MAHGSESQVLGWAQGPRAQDPYGEGALGPRDPTVPLESHDLPGLDHILTYLGSVAWTRANSF